MTTGNAEEEKNLAAAHSLSKGGVWTALLSLLLYTAVIALVLWLNLSTPSAA